MNHLGLYVHIPFCVRKCAYCDFASWAGRSNDMPRYVDALCAEIRKDLLNFFLLLQLQFTQCIIRVHCTHRFHKYR